jgi:hypothetical protein
MSIRANRTFIFALLPLIAAIPALAQGSLENGVYQDQTGVKFTLQPDWVVVSHASASDGAHTVLLRDTITNVIATVWLKSRTVDPADIPALMSRRLGSKLAQRNNFEGYRYRPESVQNSTIGGRPALSAVADYVQAGQKMVEYLTWVDGERSRVAFVARMPASELADFQGRFEAVIQSAVVP